MCLFFSTIADTKLDAQAIWEECICDSLGDMNIFASDAAQGELMNLISPEIKKTATETKAENQTRGSPDGKASREIETMENNRYSRLRKFRDNLPNVWFAYSYDYFYVYTNYSFSDYKVIKKIKIDDTNSQLIDAIERRLRDDINGDTRTFDGWVKSFQGRKRLNNGNNVNAPGGRKTSTVDGLDDSKRGGKPTNNSSKSNRISKLDGKASRELNVDALLDSITLEDLLEWDDMELYGGDTTMEDISEELNTTPEKVEIFFKREGLGDSYIEDGRKAVMTQARINNAIEYICSTVSTVKI